MKVLAIEEFETGRDVNGRFTEGHIPWLKGTRDLVRPNSGSFRPGLIPWNKGKPHPNVRGNKNPMKRPEVKARLSEARGVGIDFRQTMKHILTKKYLHEKKTGDTIATELNLSRDEIYYWLDKLQIPRRNRSEAKKGRHSCRRTEFTHARVKALWADPQYRDKVIQNTLRSLIKRPTKPEQKLIEIIKRYGLPFEYVGNGAMLVCGLNPDFVAADGQKKIIEVFGDYWHTKPGLPENRTEEGRKNIFGRDGYATLVIWETEIKNTADKEIANKLRIFVSRRDCT